MGIGRRDFLRFVGAALTGSTIAPGTLVFTRDDYYVNQALGLGFIKPAGWHFGAFRDFGYIKQRQIFASDWVDNHVKQNFNDPIALVTKYPHADTPNKREKFTPGIAIYLSTTTELDELGGLDAVVHEVAEGYALMMKDFELLEKPRKVEVSRCNAYRLKGRFLFEHERLDPPVRVDMETYCIDHTDGRHYTIHGFDSPYTGEGEQIELREGS